MTRDRILQRPGSGKDNMGNRADLNLTKDVMTLGKISFRHPLSTVALLGSKDVHDVAPSQSEEDDNAGCGLNMQDRE